MLTDLKKKKLCVFDKSFMMGLRRVYLHAKTRSQARKMTRKSQKAIAENEEANS